MAEAVEYHLTIPQYVADYELGHLEPRELAVDVVTNMRHFAAAHGESWEDILDTVELHFSAEHDGGDDADSA